MKTSCSSSASAAPEGAGEAEARQEPGEDDVGSEVLRYRCLAWLLLVAVGGVWVMFLPSSVSAEGGQRTRNCPPGTPRDPQGYCVLPPTPSNGQATKAKKRSPQEKRPAKRQVTKRAKSTESRPRPTRPRDDVARPDESSVAGSADNTTPPVPNDPPYEEPASLSAEPPDEERAPARTCSEDEEWDSALEVCVSVTRPSFETSPTYPSTEEPEETVPPNDSTSQRNPLLFPWVTLGAGLAVSLTGVILEATAYADYQGVERFNSMEELDEWAASMEGKAIAGDVLLGVGLATAVAGFVWLMLARRNRDSHDRSRRRFTIGAGHGSEESFMLHLQGE